ILVFVSIAVVLTGYGWQQYLVGSGLDVSGLQTGLKLLIAVFPIAGIVVVILCLKVLPLKGDHLKEVQEKIYEIRKSQGAFSE
ncbi:MAG: hypothetical protein ACTSU5_01085, partial [Promethearchaeota archaeon]